MTRMLIAVAMLVCASPVQAGVYSFEERHPWVSLDGIRKRVLEVRSATLPPPKGGLNPEHFKFDVLNWVKQLEAKKSDGLFTTLDRVSLSACYMRLGDRVPDALRLLVAGDKNDFLVQSNLAAAYFLSGELPMAVRHQERALALWPTVFFAWTDGDLWYYRECERALLRLYRSRADESRGRPVRENLDIDPVFPGVHYIGPSGEFEPGAISPEMREHLPDKAIHILTQLAVWFPTDMRLYWQLGLLLSSAGAIDQGFSIADELVNAGMARSFKGLPAQRRALLDAVKVFKVYSEPDKRGMLAAAMMLLPRPLFAPPGIGDAAYGVGTAGTVLAMVEVSKPPLPPAFPPPPVETGQPAVAAFNFSHVTMGFGFGFLVATLIGLQWREWRRRRQHAVSQRSYHHQPDQEGQGNGSFHGGDGPAGAGGATAPADRPPGAYRLP